MSQRPLARGARAPPWEVYFLAEHADFFFLSLKRGIYGEQDNRPNL